MSGEADRHVYGLHPVSRLLAARPQRVRQLYVSGKRDDAAIRLIVDAAEAAGLAVERCPPQRLNELAGNARHQGVLALVASIAQLNENDLQKILDAQPRPLLLALDGVQDPHNLGASLRTAEAAGVDAVIIPRNRAVGLTGSVRKVAAGAADFVPVIEVTNLARTLKDLTSQGVWCYGAAAGEGPEIYDLNLSGPVCLVLGGEAAGLRRLTRDRCDGLYRIPMYGEVESLNVSVSVAVSLYEAVRQRRRVD